MVLVIGPSRVGKTTFIRLLEERLLERASAGMFSNPTFLPFASILAAGPESSRFEWVEYYRSGITSLGRPLCRRESSTDTNERTADSDGNGLIERKPLAIIVDEAHHLAKAARGSQLQSQLDHLKHFENETGVSHILVGTYEMRPFRTVNAQLACRGVDIHFSRYDATKEEDATTFQSVLWALQRQLPVEKEPDLIKHWEFLYARSIGCIGLLKMHLNRALNLALTAQAKTVTLTHLRKTALSETRVELALSNALESEAELIEAEGADERLLKLLGMRGREEGVSPKTKAEEQARVSSNKTRPGTRAPGRDRTGQEEEAAG